MNTEHSILLVEDNRDDVLLIERAVEKAGIVATRHVVGDGEAAVRFLANRGEFSDRDHFPHPTLVLLDLKLPRKSGLEVLKWIREQEQTRSLIVVVLTSSREGGDVQQAYAAGANSYLVKPISPQKMNELISTLALYWLRLNEPPQSRSAFPLNG